MIFKSPREQCTPHSYTIKNGRFLRTNETIPTKILLILEKKYDILLTKEEKKEVEEMCTFGQGAFLAWKDYGLEKGREEGIEKESWII